ncbi:MAG: hypothetical protein D6732_08160 [Methanobacteriota archaeon]|nr:MAG: hypothetical protein D6732_08160 [Euryarchaeota archaeon]
MKSKNSKRHSNVRVNLDQLDDIVNLLGELILNRGCLEAILRDIINHNIIENLNTFDTLITSIQDKLMKMRMVPLRRVFENYPRTVRDIASKRNQHLPPRVPHRAGQVSHRSGQRSSPPPHQKCSNVWYRECRHQKEAW